MCSTPRRTQIVAACRPAPEAPPSAAALLRGQAHASRFAPLGRPVPPVVAATGRRCAVLCWRDAQSPAPASTVASDSPAATRCSAIWLLAAARMGAPMVMREPGRRLVARPHAHRHALLRQRQAWSRSHGWTSHTGLGSWKATSTAAGSSAWGASRGVSALHIGWSA